MAFKMKGPSLYKYISKTGYRKDSPDVNNPLNVIPSGDISMEDVEFNVRGEDNLGNVKVMKPGMKYKFPGKYVIETPLNKKSKLSKKISKLYKEGYVAHGQAYAIAKDMGY